MSDSSRKIHTGQQLISTTHIVALLFFLLMAGCTGVERAALPAPPPADATPREAVAVEPAVSPVEPSVSGSTGQATVQGDASVPKHPAKATVSPIPAQPPGKKSDGAASPGKPVVAPPLDLAALEKRLRETEAIGVFTKIALKNQVDDLLKQFRAYYSGRTRTTLAELRQPYDMLLLKVLSLLQDNDPGLARSIVASREVIWGLLADPDKFATL